MKIKSLAFAIVASLASVCYAASGSNSYAGIGLSSSTIDDPGASGVAIPPDNTVSPTFKKSVGLQMFYGYRFTPNFGMELGVPFVNAKDQQGNKWSVAGGDVSLTAGVNVGGNVYLYGRAGVLISPTVDIGNKSVSNVKSTGSSAAIGVDFGLNDPNQKIRLEYARYSVGFDDVSEKLIAKAIGLSYVVGF